LGFTTYTAGNLVVATKALYVLAEMVATDFDDDLVAAVFSGAPETLLMAWFVGAIVASAKADASPGGYFPTYMGKRLEAIRGFAALTDEEMAVLAILKPTGPTGFGRIRRVSGSLNQEALQVLLAIYQDANGIPKALSEYALDALIGVLLCRNP